jgi:hypothetical protein
MLPKNDRLQMPIEVVGRVAADSFRLIGIGEPSQYVVGDSAALTISGPHMKIQIVLVFN